MFRNYQGILSTLEAQELGQIITSTRFEGTGKAGILRVYHPPKYGKQVKEYLKRFAAKYPYASIVQLSGYVNYDAKKGSFASQKAAATALKKELDAIIALGGQVRDDKHDDGFGDKLNNITTYILIGVLVVLVILIVKKKK